MPFIPPKPYITPGSVLLNEAVARLAAGQSNQVRKAVAAARAKLRDELYSEAMLATVIDPETGETHTIVSSAWGHAGASIWLEQGECRLEGPWFDPRLSGGLLRNVPKVPILVREDDLRRLMAEQDGKQEPAPALGSKEREPKLPQQKLGPKSPKDWFGDTRQDHLRGKDEMLATYAERLLRLMENAHKAGHVTKLWSFETMKRRLHDK